MKITLLVFISGIIFFSFLGFVIYILFRPGSLNKNYWYKRSSNNPEEKNLQEKFSVENQKFEKYKELIRVSVSVRNLVQKLSVETKNLTNKTTEHGLFTIFESGMLDDLENKIVNIETTLADFRKNDMDLPDNLFVFKEELNKILADNREVIKYLRSSENSLTNAEEICMNVNDNHSRIIEIHREIISQFQSEFNKSLEA